jgi:hypothetical protein
METIKKVAYKGDGSQETGNKIKARLIEMGGGDATRYDYGDVIYYYINERGLICISSVLPEGYTLGVLDEPKPCIKGDWSKAYGQTIIEYLESLGGKNKYQYTGDNNLYYFINIANTINNNTTIPKGYTEISLKEPEKKDYNLAELLQGCEGMTIGSVFGDVKLNGFDMESIRNTPITLEKKDGVRLHLTKEGFESDFAKANGGEMLIFPSKENRDWGSWKKPVQLKRGELIFVSNEKEPKAWNLFIRRFDAYSGGIYFTLCNNITIQSEWAYAWKIEDCPLPLNIGGDE